MKTKLAVISNCQGCPHTGTVMRRGYGYAYDRLCMHPLAGSPRKLSCYVEWSGQDTQDGEFPAWCPLQDGEEKEKKKA